MLLIRFKVLAVLCCFSTHMPGVFSTLRPVSRRQKPLARFRRGSHAAGSIALYHVSESYARRRKRVKRSMSFWRAHVALAGMQPRDPFWRVRLAFHVVMNSCAVAPSPAKIAYGGSTMGLLPKDILNESHIVAEIAFYTAFDQCCCGAFSNL